MWTSVEPSSPSLIRKTINKKATQEVVVVVVVMEGGVGEMGSWGCFFASSVFL